MISFIGYYNYTVILTYISLFCSISDSAGLQPWYERTDWYRDPCMVRNEWCGPSRLL